MKKLFTLLVVAAVPAVLSAQSVITQIPGKKVNFPKTAKFVDGVVGSKAIAGNEIMPAKTYPKKTNKMQTSKRSAAFEQTVIGGSTYDLQTNRSVCRRIIMHPDGELSAIWTYSLQANENFTDRGTGFVNRPAGSTTWTDVPEKRFEPRRCGWPNITFDTKGDEMIVSHNAEPGTTAADTSFTLVRNTKEDRLKVKRFTPLGSGRPVIWNRSASSTDGTNDYLYVINNWNNASNGDYKEPATGITSMVYFQRAVNSVSQAGGESFVDTMIFLPGYDSTRFDAGGGDSYSIDAKDSIVAIVLGHETSDMALFVSNKYGAPGTFSKVTIDSFKYAPWKNISTYGDTLEVNEGDFSVVIGTDNNVHVFYSTVFITKDTLSANYSILASNSIYHWDLASKTITEVGGAPDLDGDGAVSGGSDYNNARYGCYSYANHPTSGVDANNNLYVVYAGISEIDTTDENAGTAIGRNYADLFYSYSTDGGATWSIPQNITNPNGDANQLEDQFPSMTKNVDNSIHLIWQQDNEPGTHVGAVTAHDFTDNLIIYTEIPAFVGLDNKSGLQGVAINAYPNPATNQVTFVTNTDKNMNVEFSMVNLLGQEVAKITKGNLAEGTNSFNVSLERIPSGVYFYSFTSNGKSITKKLVVSK